MLLIILTLYKVNKRRIVDSFEIGTSQLLGVALCAITILNNIPKTSRHATMTMQTQRLISLSSFSFSSSLYKLTIFFRIIMPWSISRWCILLLLLPLIRLYTLFLFFSSLSFFVFFYISLLFYLSFFFSSVLSFLLFLFFLLYFPLCLTLYVPVCTISDEFYFLLLHAVFFLFQFSCGFFWEFFQY